MKRTWMMLSALLLACSLVACGGQTADEATASDPVDSESVSIQEPADKEETPSEAVTDEDETVQTSPSPLAESGSSGENEESLNAPTGGSTAAESNTSAGGNTEASNSSHIHNYASATCTTPKTCTICGETEGVPLGHTPGRVANCWQKSVCSRCQLEYGDFDPNNHDDTMPWILKNWGAYPATCEKDGYTGDRAYCNICHSTVKKGDIIPALNHDISEVFEYDREKDQIKQKCIRQGCSYAKYTGIQPLTIKLKIRSCVEILGGFVPDCKVYINGGAALPLQGWPASSDYTYRGYYFNYTLESGDIITVEAFDKSGRNLTKKYQIIDRNGALDIQELPLG